MIAPVLGDVMGERWKMKASLTKETGITNLYAAITAVDSASETEPA